MAPTQKCLGFALLQHLSLLENLDISIFCTHIAILHSFFSTLPFLVYPYCLILRQSPLMAVVNRCFWLIYKKAWESNLVTRPTAEALASP